MAYYVVLEKTMRTVNTSSLMIITTHIATSYVSKWEKLLELRVHCYNCLLQTVTAGNGIPGTLQTIIKTIQYRI